MCPLDDIDHRCGRGRGVVQAQAPYWEVLPDGVDRRFVAVPAFKIPPIARVAKLPGYPDLPGPPGDMQLKEPPVGGDRPGRRCVQAVIGEECYGRRFGDPRVHQGVLTAVITDDDRLTRRDTLLNERHDEGAKLGVGAVEAGFMAVAHLAAGGAGPHHRSPGCTCPGCSRPSSRRTRQTMGGIDRAKTGTWHASAYESRE